LLLSNAVLLSLAVLIFADFVSFEKVADQIVWRYRYWQRNENENCALDWTRPRNPALRTLMATLDSQPTWFRGEITPQHLEASHQRIRTSELERYKCLCRARLGGAPSNKTELQGLRADTTCREILGFLEKVVKFGRRFGRQLVMELRGKQEAEEYAARYGRDGMPAVDIIVSTCDVGDGFDKTLPDGKPVIFFARSALPNTIAFHMPSDWLYRIRRENCAADREAFAVVASAKVPWHMRAKKLFWRGSFTNQRRKVLVDMAAKHKDKMDCKFSGFPYISDEERARAVAEYGENVSLNRVALEQHQRWRYLVDIDGFGWSGRFSELMLTGSVVFKAMGFVEYWYAALKPWEHYVPVQSDLSDLLQRYDEAVASDTRMRAIAQRAYDFSLHNLNVESVVEFFFWTLYLYSRQLTFDPFSLPPLERFLD
jgi:hypothetical protein